jgi:hypothetical protein
MLLVWIRGAPPLEVLGAGAMTYVLLRILPADMGAWLRQPAVQKREPRTRSPVGPYEDAPLQTWICVFDQNAATVAERLGLLDGRPVPFREGLQAATSGASPVFLVEAAGHVLIFGSEVGLSDWHRRASQPEGRAYAAFLDERSNNAVLSFAQDGEVVRTLSGDPDSGVSSSGVPRPGEPALGDDAALDIAPWWAVVRAWGGLDPSALVAESPREGHLCTSPG